MNPSSSKESSAWTPRRWGWTIGLLFLGQLLVAWFLADRTPLAIRKSRNPTRYRLVTDERETIRLNANLAPGDPALLALISAHNFSGAIWQQYPRMIHALADWTETPSWLSPRLDRLGSRWGDSIRPPADGPTISAEQANPPWAVLTVTNEPLLSQSVLRIQGDLVNRPLVTPLTLPCWTNKTVLTNSEVQIIVGPDGCAFSAILQASCGETNADQQALELSRACRFQPRPRPDPADAWNIPALQWGILVFQWVTRDASPVETTGNKSPP
jgi:hypothetical protein